jgi:hypothetical protein
VGTGHEVDEFTPAPYHAPPLEPAVIEALKPAVVKAFQSHLNLNA